MSEDKIKEEEDKSILEDPFDDEEDEDIILKTQMKIYDLFMGNWKKLVYITMHQKFLCLAITAFKAKYKPYLLEKLS